MSDSGRFISWLAIFAVAGLLLWQSTQATLGTPLVWSALVCAVFAALVAGVMLLLAPDGCRHLARHPRLLVPLGLTVGALGLLEALGLGTPLHTLSVGFVALPLSVAWVLRLLILALSATWTTVLVVDAVHRDRTDLVDALSRSKPLYLRMLLLLCLMWSAHMMLFAVELPILFALTMGSARLLGGLGVVAVWTLILCVLGYRFLINLATAALLPVAVQDTGGFWATFRQGLAESWRSRRRWWGLLLAQYVLVGAGATVHYQYSHAGGPFASNTNFDFNFSYFASWTGDYAFDAKLYSEAMSRIGHEPIALVTTLCALLVAVLSIVVKLSVVERLDLPGPQEVAPAGQLFDGDPPTATHPEEARDIQ